MVPLTAVASRTLAGRPVAGGLAAGGLADRLRTGASPAAALGDRGAENLVPVLAPLVPLFPAGGLRRGSTVAVEGSASLLLALLAGASAAGSWCAAVGLPRLGAAAAAEAGVDLSRMAFVPDPGTDLAGVVAALADGMDVVAVGNGIRLHAAEVRRLAARARQRGTVLVGFGGWHGAEVRLSITSSTWHGLADGSGSLESRRVTVQAGGRGSAARPRTTELWLPGPAGTIAAAALVRTEIGPAPLVAPAAGATPGAQATHPAHPAHAAAG